MDVWFVKYISKKIWNAIGDAFGELAGKTETQIKSYLASLKGGDELSKSPLVRVLEVENPPNTVTLLILGRVNLFGGVESAFMRIEIVISKDVDLTTGSTPIEIIEWRTVIGDLKLKKENVFESNIALGYDKGVWLGRGALKIIPADFGLDVFIGGINERGAMIGLKVDIPTPIPLGCTGIGLVGLGGDFAYNFVPRLELEGVPVTNPTAKNYVNWARNLEPDRWQPGPIDTTAVGLGICTDLVSLADSGYILTLEQIGFTVLTPGPIFVFGGSGYILKIKSAKVEGCCVVDIPSQSFAIGLSAHIKIPDSDEFNLIDAEGIIDSFFSIKDPSQWFINFGTDEKPILIRILFSYHGEAFLMINNHRIEFGVNISCGGDWGESWISVIARVGARVVAFIGWNPKELEGSFAIYGELGIKIWKFKFLLTLQAQTIGYLSTPTQLDINFKLELDLPWPVPDVELEKMISYSDASPQPPLLDSPFLVGEYDAW